MVAATDIGFARMRVSKAVVLNDGDGICSAEAVLMRRALTAPPMTITRAEP